MDPKRPGSRIAAAILSAFICGHLACSLAPKPAALPTRAETGGALPRKVAVLPFDNRSANPEAAVILRRMFYNFFSSLNFIDVEPAAVDVSLEAEGLLEKIPADDPRIWPRLGQLLGVDAVVVGEVLSYGQVYALLYANQQAGLKARLVECRTGRTLWELEHAVTLHDGDLPLSLPGLAAAVVKTAISFQQANLLHAAAELCMQMTATIPNPPSTFEAPPRIQTLVHNGAAGLLLPGDTLRVVMLGDRHRQASLSLPPLLEGIPMDEREPGVYVASYRIRPADRLAEGRLTGTLRSADGAGRQWVDTLGPIRIGNPTRLPAAIKTDTVLRAAQSPFLAADALVVARGATLTVEPGVVIWFARLGMVVRGRLDVRGTAENPVTFSGLAPAGWKGIFIEAGGDAGTLRHCRVSGAEYGLRSARSRVRVENCRFQENGWGLVMEDGQIDIDRSLIRASAKAGISARGSRLAVTGSVVTENRRGGFVLENSQAFIAGNNILNNGEWGVKVIDGRSEVQAGHNWWGAEDPAPLETVKGPVAIHPVLKQPAALCSGSARTWLEK
jgi:hypothetical protein